MGLITSLRDDIAARLGGDDYFSDAASQTPNPIEVLTERVGDIETMIKEIINKLGISVMVLTGRLEPGPNKNQGTATVIVGISERVILNQGPGGTNKPAADVGEAAWALLDGWRPNDAWSPLEAQGLQVVDVSPLLVYELELLTHTFLK